MTDDNGRPAQQTVSSASPPPRRPDPQPLPHDGVGTVAVGTLVWLVLLLVAIMGRDQLHADGHDWWLATAAVGTGLGLLGLAYCRRRAQRLRGRGINPGA